MAIKASNQITFIEHKKIVEIKEWYLATPENTNITTETDGWTDTIQTMDETNKYLWNFEEVVYSIGSSEKSEPVIIGFYGKGADGKGIDQIQNYYLITQAPELPENPEWSKTVDILTPINKYLWNYEEIIYTDNTSQLSEPAIIGVYGDSGTDSVDFQIYSVDGFEFNSSLTEIELKTAAFFCGKDISHLASYQWQWWNIDEELYEDIENATESTLIVDMSSIYAFTDLKCIIVYDGQTYEDHVSLTKQTAIHTSVAKFFDGSNIFSSDDLYLIVYLEMYQNSLLAETIGASTYCSDVVSVSSGVITTDLPENYTDGEQMYFVYKDDDIYRVVLGEYTSGVWNVVDVETQYTYTNNMYPTVTSNIIAISKEHINKSRNIDFIIYQRGEEVSRTYVNIIDINDPIISDVAPQNAVNGQIWLDTSTSPHILKMYNGTEWVECSEKIGGAVFTSRPNAYSAGDLWVLADGEVCEYELDNVTYKFEAGSMLRSTSDSKVYVDYHWIDADADSTKLKSNIKQYLKFDASTGLRIGQTGDKFYVNISATRMSFCDDASIEAAATQEVVDKNEVVSISNSSATIQNAKLKGNTEFYGQINICDPESNPNDDVVDTLFIWKVEQNGSFSLAVAT